MALHLNTWGLQQRGFKLVAVYECFTKLRWNEYRKKFDWYYRTVKCFKSDTHYLVRFVSSKGYVWDEVYSNKADANAHVKRILDNSTFHKTMKY